MNDAAGENVDEHIQALEGQVDRLQDSMDNDQSHLDPRYVAKDDGCATGHNILSEPSSSADLHRPAAGTSPRLFSP
jgi:hypothetical protein